MNIHSRLLPSKKLVLKPGREKSVLGKHPWIFSGAVASIDSFNNGDMLQVVDSKGVLLGCGYCNKKSQIICRMVSFGEVNPYEALERRLLEAIHLRRSLLPRDTTAYRLISSEGDFLPGLIVDVFGDTVVLQIGTLGMERLKERVVALLVRELRPAWVYEKSTGSSRVEEGLKQRTETLYGEEKELVLMRENGIEFWIDIVKGQKTGFFLDQQGMRSLVRELAPHKRVLNCFSYTGGFSLYAMQGGALSCDSVDISDEAVLLTKKNIIQNGLEHVPHRLLAEDVFSFLRADPLAYDLVILDPPAFAKKKKDVVQALRGYKDINRLAMEKMPSGSLLLTASCSYHVDEALFRKMLFQAACDAKRDVRILETHRHSWDHPQSLFCPEGDYLKSFLLYLS